MDDFVEPPESTIKVSDIENYKNIADKTMENTCFSLEQFLNNIRKGTPEKNNKDLMEEYNKVEDKSIIFQFLKTKDKNLIKNNAFLNQVYEEHSLKTAHFSDLTVSGCNFKPKPIIFRFYVNMTLNEDTANFILDYQRLCEENGYSYTMKPFKNDTIDKTIFYATVEDVADKISYIRQLLKKYPKIKFGTPIEATAHIEIEGQKIGFCNNGRLTRNYSSLTGEAIIQNTSTYNECVAYAAANAYCKIYDAFAPKNMKKEEFLKQQMDDPFARKKMIALFKKQLIVEWNRLQNLPLDRRSNIATDTWYMVEKLQGMNLTRTKSSI